MSTRGKGAAYAMSAIGTGAAAIPVAAFVDIAAGLALLALPVYLIYKAG